MLRNRVRDCLPQELLDVSLSSSDVSFDVDDNDDDDDDDSERTRCQRDDVGRPPLHSHAHHRSAHDIADATRQEEAGKSGFQQRKQALLHKHAAVLGLQPREVKRLLRGHSHTPADGHGLDFKELVVAVSADGAYSAAAAAAARKVRDPDASLKILCAKALCGGGQGGGSSGGSHGGDGRSPLVPQAATVDAALLQHVLAELVGERVRLQAMSEQFSRVVVVDSSGTRSSTAGSAAVQLQMLQTSLYNYETILREVKTQLIAEHQARSVITKRYQALKAGLAAATAHP